MMAQSPMARGHRVRKTQPEGGLIGLGISPLSTTRDRLRPGLGIGIADNRAWV